MFYELRNGSEQVVLKNNPLVVVSTHPRAHNCYLLKLQSLLSMIHHCPHCCRSVFALKLLSVYNGRVCNRLSISLSRIVVNLLFFFNKFLWLLLVVCYPRSIEPNWYKRKYFEASRDKGRFSAKKKEKIVHLQQIWHDFLHASPSPYTYPS